MPKSTNERSFTDPLANWFATKRWIPRTAVEPSVRYSARFSVAYRGVILLNTNGSGVAGPFRKEPEREDGARRCIHLHLQLRNQALRAYAIDDWVLDGWCTWEHIVSFGWFSHRATAF